jgi:hypothetical protein
MKYLLSVLLIFTALPCTADTFVQLNGLSFHDRSGYNGWNYGAGIEQSLSTNWSAATGWYRNSEYRGSAYGYVRYSVYQKNSWNIGFGAGMVTGYQRATIVPMAFPEICFSWLCAVAFPRVEATGANVLGVRLRIPVN